MHESNGLSPLAPTQELSVPSRHGVCWQVPVRLTDSRGLWHLAQSQPEEVAAAGRAERSDDDS
ncbi:hypothetical protein ACIBCN_06640 [Nocardia sp. NPDC051052]|uniref:hypothetical protein n=1 Tax=Nocardia sp. NPDC051052 TaxID=3364322 RepID=UPI0037931CB1